MATSSAMLMEQASRLNLKIVLNKAVHEWLSGVSLHELIYRWEESS